MANVVWREEINPSEDLTKLSQYARAYSATTMDKTPEVICYKSAYMLGTYSWSMIVSPWDLNLWFWTMSTRQMC